MRTRRPLTSIVSPLSVTKRSRREKKSPSESNVPVKPKLNGIAENAPALIAPGAAGAAPGRSLAGLPPPLTLIVSKSTPARLADVSSCTSSERVSSSVGHGLAEPDDRLVVGLVVLLGAAVGAHERLLTARAGPRPRRRARRGRPPRRAWARAPSSSTRRRRGPPRRATSRMLYVRLTSGPRRWSRWSWWWSCPARLGRRSPSGSASAVGVGRLGDGAGRGHRGGADLGGVALEEHDDLEGRALARAARRGVAALGHRAVVEESTFSSVDLASETRVTPSMSRRRAIRRATCVWPGAQPGDA